MAQALHSTALVGCPLRSARVVPFTARRAPLRAPRAEPEANSSAPAASDASSAGATIINFKNYGVLNYPHNDPETFKDVFGFAGSAPERVNGRIAMISFLAAIAAEASTHASVSEQLAAGWPAVLLLNLSIVVGSIAPKFTAGRPLSELHAAASSQNMSGGEGQSMFFSFFEGNTELWTGRVAMLGFAGLVANELFLKHGALL